MALYINRSRVNRIFVVCPSGRHESACDLTRDIWPLHTVGIVSKADEAAVWAKKTGSEHVDCSNCNRRLIVYSQYGAFQSKNTDKPKPQPGIKRASGWR